MEPRNIDLNDNAGQENPGGEGGAGDAKSPIRRERSRSPNRNLPESEVPPLPAGEGSTSAAAAAAESSGGVVQERTCIVCGRVFEGAKSMHGHLRVHTEEERRSAVQPRLFSTWDVYLRMLELHDGNIPADLLTRLERNLKGREEEMEAARLEALRRSTATDADEGAGPSAAGTKPEAAEKAPATEERESSGGKDA